ncbi:uncharacterized protein LOC117651420 [Thrips palmi]|uniref:Uncharacterized protein LOC117651420 n=1 Tax=Thrips palmi TaxID=161013 RepID=A0A6P9A1Q7_THRPL|nr:uncharacterized protein LOC117651420 [Thrips palmi]
MKFATFLLSAFVGLALLTQQSMGDTVYETFIATHGWRFGHYVGACTLEAYNKYPGFGASAWAGICTCHTQSVTTSAPYGVNLGPYMRSLITCTLISTIPGVAVIGAEMVHCVANKVNAYVGLGGK